AEPRRRRRDRRGPRRGARESGRHGARGPRRDAARPGYEHRSPYRLPGNPLGLRRRGGRRPRVDSRRGGGRGDDRGRRGALAARAGAGVSHRDRLRRHLDRPDPPPARDPRRACVLRNYLVAMLTFAGLYGLMALGLNLVWGMTGLINLGLAGFFAAGAYASALVTVKLGLPIAVGLVAAALFAAATGAVMALTTRNLRGDYLAIVTLGFSEVVRLVASNEIWLTQGTDGISGIPGPWRGRVTPETFNLIYLAIVATFVVAALGLLERVRRSPYGRVLRAIRDDDQVAAVAGK